MTTIYIDITNNLLQRPNPENRRVVREMTQFMIEKQEMHGWCIRLLCWSEEKAAYRVVHQKRYLQRLAGNVDLEECYTGQLLLPEQLRKGSIFFDIDCVWRNRPYRPYLLSVLKHRGVKIAAWVYDIFPVTHPQFYPPDCLYLQYLDAELAYADILFVASEWVEQEIRKLIGQLGKKGPEIVHIPLGTSYSPCMKSDPNIDRATKKIAQTAPYIFVPTVIEPRSNQTVVLNAYNRCLQRRGVNVIFSEPTQSGGSNQMKNQIIKHPHFGKRIFCFENVGPETESYLHQKALFTIVPSYVETSSEAITDALLSHTPVLLPDNEMMHEMAGEYAGYFPPEDAERLAELICQGLCDSTAYQQQKRKLCTYRPVSWDAFCKNLAGHLPN